MKIIKLTQNKECFVDDEDYDELIKYKWRVDRDRRNFYVSRNSKQIKGKRYTIKMHRFILNIIDSKIQVDHIDGNGLNNQKNNLRACTASQNCMNMKKTIKSSSSKYKGVSIHKSKYKEKCSYKYLSRIDCNKKWYYLGVFPFTEEGERQAAMAYNNKAIELFGEFARLNEIYVEN